MKVRRGKTLKNSRTRSNIVASVYKINGNTLDIRVSGSPSTLKHVFLSGDMSSVSVGDSVLITWVNSRPVALLM